MFITKLIWSIDSHKQCKITFNFGEFVLFHNYYSDRLLVWMQTLLLFITPPPPPKKEFNIRWYFSHLLSMLSKIKFLKFRDLIAGRSWHMKWSRRALFSTSVGTGGKLKGLEERQTAFMSILNTSTFQVFFYFTARMTLMFFSSSYFCTTSICLVWSSGWVV